jgi:hypothetical protein
LYKKYGFEVAKVYRLEARAKFDDRERGNIIFMERPRTSGGH